MVEQAPGSFKAQVVRCRQCGKEWTTVAPPTCWGGGWTTTLAATLAKLCDEADALRQVQGRTREHV